MPYIGLSPFLQFKKLVNEGDNFMCQCPTSGYPHFYRACPHCCNEGIMCQCPTSGYPHFYQNKAELDKNYVSMPYIGLSPFLLYFVAIEPKKKECVNALHRAIPISTVTSRNPHKQGAQFRNNSYNCQTIHFCPYFYSIFPSFDISAFFLKWFVS